MKHNDTEIIAPCEHHEVHESVILKKRKDMPPEGELYDLSDFFKILGEDSCTVDNTHPNDLGFMAMALGIRPVLEPLLK